MDPVPVQMHTPELFCFSGTLLSACISYKDGLKNFCCDYGMGFEAIEGYVMV